MTATARLWTCVLCGRTFGGNGHCDHCGRYHDGSEGPYTHSREIAPWDAVYPPQVTRAVAQMAQIAGRDEPDGIWRCHYCRAQLVRVDRVHHGSDPREWPCRDHVIPRGRGGPNTLSNLVLACYPCNIRKGVRLLSELPDGWATRRGAVV